MTDIEKLDPKLRRNPLKRRRGIALGVSGLALLFGSSLILIVLSPADYTLPLGIMVAGLLLLVGGYLTLR